MNGKRFAMKTPLAGLAAVVVVAMLNVAPALGGSVTAGGWTASWDKALDEVLGLTALSTGADTVSFNKFAQFTNPPNEDGAFEPLVITFQQSSPTAKKWILINQESVVNQSGRDWTGFDFVIAPPAANGLGFDDGKTFPAISSQSFSISPFTTHELSADGKVLSLGGGTVPTLPIGENVWNPGQISGALWINAAPMLNGMSRSFELKEIPTTAAAVPLPAAIWPGMALMGLLGAGKLRKRPA
jgi:hypothetical protein